MISYPMSGQERSNFSSPSVSASRTISLWLYDAYKIYIFTHLVLFLQGIRKELVREYGNVMLIAESFRILIAVPLGTFQGRIPR